MTTTQTDRAAGMRMEIERLRRLLRLWLEHAAEHGNAPPPALARLTEDTRRALVHCGPDWAEDDWD